MIFMHSYAFTREELNCGLLHMVYVSYTNKPHATIVRVVVYCCFFNGEKILTGSLQFGSSDDFIISRDLR